MNRKILGCILIVATIFIVPKSHLFTIVHQLVQYLVYPLLYIGIRIFKYLLIVSRLALTLLGSISWNLIVVFSHLILYIHSCVS